MSISRIPAILGITIYLINSTLPREQFVEWVSSLMDGDFKASGDQRGAFLVHSIN